MMWLSQKLCARYIYVALWRIYRWSVAIAKTWSKHLYWQPETRLAPWSINQRNITNLVFCDRRGNVNPNHTDQIPTRSKQKCTPTTRSKTITIICKAPNREMPAWNNERHVCHHAERGREEAAQWAGRSAQEPAAWLNPKYDSYSKLPAAVINMRWITWS